MRQRERHPPALQTLPPRRIEDDRERAATAAGGKAVWRAAVAEHQAAEQADGRAQHESTDRDR